MGPQQCKVCESAYSKYKCPACLLPYCSLSCYKQHKETPCSRSEPSQEAHGAKVAERGSVLQHKQPLRPYELDEEHEWRLQKSHFESIADSEDLRTMLKDPKLQELIRMIDSSSDAEKDMNVAMEAELFREFRDKVLAIINPEQAEL